MKNITILLIAFLLSPGVLHADWFEGVYLPYIDMLLDNDKPKTLRSLTREAILKDQILLIPAMQQGTIPSDLQEQLTVSGRGQEVPSHLPYPGQDFAKRQWHRLHVNLSPISSPLREFFGLDDIAWMFTKLLPHLSQPMFHPFRLMFHPFQPRKLALAEGQLSVDDAMNLALIPTDVLAEITKRFHNFANAKLYANKTARDQQMAAAALPHLWIAMIHLLCEVMNDARFSLMFCVRWNRTFFG